MKARQLLTAAVAVNGRGARAADAGDNGCLVVQGTATAVGKCRGCSATAQVETRMRRAESRRQEPRRRQRQGWLKKRRQWWLWSRRSLRYGREI